MKSRISLKSLLLLVGLCAVLFATYQFYRQHQREHVTIHVVDSVNGKPLTEFDYLLSISSTNDANPESSDWVTQQSRDGVLYFEVPENCLVQLKIESLKIGRGYLAQKHEFLLTRNGAREFQFGAKQAISVNGTITNKATGKPVKDVVVLHYGYDGRSGYEYATHQVKTDEFGKYKINCVSRNGMLTYFKVQLQDELDIIGIKPPVNGVVNGLDIQMQTTPTLTGQVVDESGAPIIGASVQITGEGNRPERPSTVTDKEGRFSIPAVHNELNTIYVRSENHKSRSTSSDVPHEPLRVVLKKKTRFRVSAQVVTPQGHSVSDFRFWTSSTDSKRIQNLQGKFVLDEGPHCAFVVQAKGFPAVGKQIDFQHVIPNSQNESIAELTIKLHAGCRVIGNITDGPEHWLGVAYLTPHDSESCSSWFVDNGRMDYEVDTDGILQHQTTITDGKYEFDSVSPGFYVLHVDGPKMSPQERLVRIADDTEQTLAELRYVPSATITGQFFAGSHADTKRFAFRKGFVRRGFSSPKIHFTADAQGKFHVEDVPIGPMKVWSQSQERGVHLQPAGSAHVIFDDPDPDRVVPILLHSSYSIADRTYRVKLLDKHHVRTVGSWANDQLRSVQQTNEEILLRDIPEGKYDLVVSALNGRWRHTTPIEVAYPMSKIDLSLPTGVAEGSVTINSTKTNSSMWELRLLQLDAANHISRFAYVNPSTSRFRFAGLMPGKYQAVVSDHDLVPVRSEVFTIKGNTKQWHCKAVVTPKDQLGSLHVRITLEDFEKVPRELIMKRDGVRVEHKSTEGWHNQTEEFTDLAPGTYTVVATDEEGNALKEAETSIQTGSLTNLEL